MKRQRTDGDDALGAGAGAGASSDEAAVPGPVVSYTVTVYTEDDDLSREMGVARSVDWTRLCAQGMALLRGLEDADLMPASKATRGAWQGTGPTAVARDALVKLFELLSTFFVEHCGCRLRLDWEFCGTYVVSCMDSKPSPKLLADISRLNGPAKTLKDRYMRSPPRRDSRAIDRARALFMSCLESPRPALPMIAHVPLHGTLDVYAFQEFVSFDMVDQLD